MIVLLKSRMALTRSQSTQLRLVVVGRFLVADPLVPGGKCGLSALLVVKAHRISLEQCLRVVAYFIEAEVPRILVVEMDCNS